ILRVQSLGTLACHEGVGGSGCPAWCPSSLTKRCAILPIACHPSHPSLVLSRPGLKALGRAKPGHGIGPGLGVGKAQAEPSSSGFVTHFNTPFPYINIM